MIVMNPKGGEYIGLKKALEAVGKNGTVVILGDYTEIDRVIVTKEVEKLGAMVKHCDIYKDYAFEEESRMELMISINEPSKNIS